VPPQRIALIEQSLDATEHPGIWFSFGQINRSKLRPLDLYDTVQYPEFFCWVLGQPDRKSLMNARLAAHAEPHVPKTAAVGPQQL
jgi:hypothetical protein